MNAKPGDLITIEAEHVGQPEREGEILEVIHGPLAVSYRIKWQDGRETMLTPAAGSARVLPKPAKRSTKPAAPASKSRKSSKR
jgi:hypothetical protein